MTRRVEVARNARQYGLAIQSPYWSKLLLAQLEQQPIVRRVKCLASGLMVFYCSGLREIYWYEQKRSKRRSFAIQEADARIEHVPEVYRQYPGTFNDSVYPHLCIQRKQWNAASFIEQRLALHSFIQQLRKFWVCHMPVPDHVLLNDLRRIRQTPAESHYDDEQLLTTCRGGNRGQAIAQHFFDVSPELRHIWSNPRKINLVIKPLLGFKCDIDTAGLLRLAARRIGKPFPWPTLYMDLLRLLGAKKAVLDLYPDLGSRAVACAVLGIKYYTLPEPGSRFEHAIDCGFGEFLKLDWAHYQGERVDLVLSDKNYRNGDLEQALQYVHKAVHIAVYAELQQIQEWQDRYRPTQVLTLRQGRPKGYYLIW